MLDRVKVKEFLTEENWCRFAEAKKKVTITYRKAGTLDRRGKKLPEIIGGGKVACSITSPDACYFCLIGAMKKCYPANELLGPTTALLNGIKFLFGVEGKLLSEWQDQANWEDVESLLDHCGV